VVCGARDERKLPQTFVDYVESAREYTLSVISTSSMSTPRLRSLQPPHDQIREQLR